MQFIETHAHLDMIERKPEIVIRDALSEGIIRIITIGVDLESSRKNMQVARQFENVYTGMGFHPHESKEMNEQEPEKVLRFEDTKEGWSAFLVMDSFVKGAASGGVRIAPGLTLTGVKILAGEMTKKYLFTGPPIRGGGGERNQSKSYFFSTSSSFPSDNAVKFGMWKPVSSICARGETYDCP